jgi:hypothetical protein
MGPFVILSFIKLVSFTKINLFILFVFLFILNFHLFKIKEHYHFQPMNLPTKESIAERLQIKQLETGIFSLFYFLFFG